MRFVGLRKYAAFFLASWDFDDKQGFHFPGRESVYSWSYQENCGSHLEQWL